MLKSVKISGKIFIGFGVVLVCISIIAAAVIISNITLEGYMRTIDDRVHFQEEAAYLQKEFSNGNTEATILYHVASEEAYEHGAEHYDEAEKALTSMESQVNSSSDLRHFASNLADIRKNLELWGDKVDELNEGNSVMETLADDGVNLGMTLNGKAGEMYDSQIKNLVSDVEAEREAEALIRRSTRIDHAAKILNDSQVIVRFVDMFVNTRDTDMVPAITGMLDALTASLEQYHQNSSQAHDQNLATASIEALAGYKTLVNNAVGIIDGHNTLISVTEKLVSDTDALILAFVSEINDDVSNVIKESEALNAMVMYVSIGLALFALFIGILMAVVVSRAISKPIVTIAAFFKKAGTSGDLSLQPENVKLIQELAKGRDEFRDLSEGAASFVGHVTNIAEEIQALADGDLTIEVDKLSDKDVIGNAMMHVVEKLNEMFSAINDSSASVEKEAAQIQENADQIAASTNNIAEGAQLLATGSTEQAESVRALSESMTEIAEKTQANTEMAEKASKLADKIIGNAQKGSHQMEEMIKAVDEITAASREINTIIGAINEIASQTNLLSLNASIEAARAGEHGRGFAVVASEVGKLAEESTASAAETNVIIQTSIDKAELGAKIVEETAKSLQEIIAGINESSSLIKEIAIASDEQLQGIQKINQGINMVSGIIEQNSATAEESAAASEECAASATDSSSSAQHMNELASNLHNLVSQFKLRA